MPSELGTPMDDLPDGVYERLEILTPTDQFVPVPVELLKLGLEEILQAPPEPDGFLQVPPTLLTALAAYIRENDGDTCDHDVGICNCTLRNLMNDLDLAAVGLQMCLECGGDGRNYEIDEATEAVREGMCPTCKGDSFVSIQLPETARAATIES